MSFHAYNLLKAADVIVGYKTYVKLIEGIVDPHQEIHMSGMKKEVDRSREAIEIALQGKKVAVISSGDPGVFGMAGIILEMVYHMGKEGEIEVEVVPGISAANAAAASLGAPLMHDYVVLSLSDLLTPWELIKKRAALAAQGDFVIALYNPRSKGRVTQIEEVQEILLQYKSPKTPVGIVKNAKRGNEEIILATLDDFTQQDIDMFSLVIIGNSQTYIKDGRLITPRGYKI